MNDENFLALLLDAHRARRGGAEAIANRQRARLAEMVAFARSNSPYYRALYQDAPVRVEDVTLLPPTAKKPLMARFDEWVTDRAATVEEVRAFVDRPELIGERFLDKYTIATTSGTTGTRGIFLLDDRSMAVTGALAFRTLSSWLTAGDVIRIIFGGGRLAMVNAVGGHFASAVAATRLRRRRGERVHVFPVNMPLPDMVAQLNRFRPALLTPYASMGALLATEQKAGRLNISPVLVVLSAEGLPKPEYARIAEAFNAKVRHSYAATECPFLSYSCEQGWLHVNSDWVIFESVDRQYRPVPPGERSHTVLITNLANRVQPILRYDLGDSILQRPDPCECGNPLAAIRVQGRAADVLTFPAERGERVTIAPLTFATLLDDIPGIELSQIAQTRPTHLEVRLRLAQNADAGLVWRRALGALTALLAKHGLGHVTVERTQQPPSPSPGGKYRAVIPFVDSAR